MERFAAMVASRRAAPAPGAEEVLGRAAGKAEQDAAYLSIQLEEIVIVKNDAHADSHASLGAAHSSNTVGGGAASARVVPSASAFAAVEGCDEAAAAARDAWSTTVAWIAGSN